MIIISDIVFEEIKKKDTVLFARVIPKIGYYELLELYIVSVYSDYVTGTDKKTKQTFCFGKNLAQNVLFKDRKKAIAYLNKKEQENKKKGIKVYSE